jgi:hypothetical protein
MACTSFTATGERAAVHSPTRILTRLRDVVEGSYRSDVACASNAPNSGQLPDVLGVHLSLTREFLERERNPLHSPSAALSSGTL